MNAERTDEVVLKFRIRIPSEKTENVLTSFSNSKSWIRMYRNRILNEHYSLLFHP